MLNLFTKYRGYIIGAALGAVAGFIYWRFVGCSSGSCPITSHWHTTTLYGAVLGMLIGAPSQKKKAENQKSNL